MFETFQPVHGSTIECATCVAADTSACGECVVTHLLANDAGPIEYVPTPVALVSPTDRAVELFVRAGLVDDPVVFVAPEEFEQWSAAMTSLGAN
jgi:hypothetical protein